MGIAE